MFWRFRGTGFYLSLNADVIWTVTSQNDSY